MPAYAFSAFSDVFHALGAGLGPHASCLPPFGSRSRVLNDAAQPRRDAPTFTRPPTSNVNSSRPFRSRANRRTRAPLLDHRADDRVQSRLALYEISQGYTTSDIDAAQPIRTRKCLNSPVRLCSLTLALAMLGTSLCTHDAAVHASADEEDNGTGTEVYVHSHTLPPPSR